MPKKTKRAAKVAKKSAKKPAKKAAKKPAKKAAKKPASKPAKKAVKKAVKKPAKKAGKKASRPAPARKAAPAHGHQPPPPMQLMQMVMGFMVSKSISAAAKLGLADHLAGGPLYYTDLAAVAGLDQKALHRLMRALASVGVFKETAPGTYGLTPLSELLRSGVRGSLRDMAVMVTTPSHWLPWGKLEETLRAGISVADSVLGTDLWAYYRENAEEGAWFNGAMTSFSGMTAGAVLEAYDFSKARRIIDVGGGHGFLLSTLLAAAPQATGAVYDLPQVTQTAPAPDPAVADRIEFIGGDFFQFVPIGGDIYTLKHIIHDWPDDQCRTILRNIANSMNSDGKVLILDAVLPDECNADPGFVMDLNMLAMTPGGCERTAHQFNELVQSSGLRISRIIQTPSPVCVIECVKA